MPRCSSFSGGVISPQAIDDGPIREQSLAATRMRSALLMTQSETLSAEWETLRHRKVRTLDLESAANDGGLLTHRTLVSDA